jgi:hypothetical protein
MKKILVTAVLVGAAAAALILYMMDEYSETDFLDDVDDASSDAYRTMNRGIGRVERTVEDGFDSTFG